MGLSVGVCEGKSSWMSIIGSTVTEGDLQEEHVTVEVRDPANVWSDAALATARSWHHTGLETWGERYSRAIQLQLDI